MVGEEKRKSIDLCIRNTPMSKPGDGEDGKAVKISTESEAGRMRSGAGAFSGRGDPARPRDDRRAPAGAARGGEGGGARTEEEKPARVKRGDQLRYQPSRKPAAPATSSAAEGTADAPAPPKVMVLRPNSGPSKKEKNLFDSMFRICVHAILIGDVLGGSGTQPAAPVDTPTVLKPSPAPVHSEQT